MATYAFSNTKGQNQTFSSSKENLTHVVLFADGRIAAKCSSLELAKKAISKDERLYDLQDMAIVSLDKVQQARQRPGETLSSFDRDLLKSLIVMTSLCTLKYGNLDAEVSAEIEKANALITKATA